MLPWNRRQVAMETERQVATYREVTDKGVTDSRVTDKGVTKE